MTRRLGSMTLVALWLLTPGLRAQESASSGIVGQVVDSTRGAMPGATVTVINVGTNAQRVVNTDAEGRFSVPNLPPATYSVRVELSGFATAELKELVLRNGEVGRPTITLGLANVAETVTVVGLSPLLQTTNASVSQTITQKQIEDLPVAGRGLLSFASLSAGVTPQAFNRGTQFGAAGSSRSQYVTVEGGRDSSTNYAIDGVYVRSLRFNNLSLNPPLDAVQEVNVLRNSFTTEYGQGQAVVSIVTKSGSNRLTGSAYDYIRSQKAEAENYFGQKPGDRTQAGATGGGPIVRNRFFVFGGYEALRSTSPKTLFAAVPSATQLAGNFSGLSTAITDPLTGLPFPGNVIPSGRFSNFAKILAPTVPAANNAGANNYRTVRDLTDDADTATIRARSDPAEPQSLSAVHVLQRLAAEPERVQLHEPSAERQEFRRGRYLGCLAEARQRDPVRLQLRLPPELADQPRRSQLGGRYRDAQPGRRHRSDRLRPSRIHDDRLQREWRGRHYPGRDRKHLQRVQRDQLGAGPPQRPLRDSGAVPQVRSADRGAAARRLHVQRTVHRQSGRRLPARLLLDVHRRVRQLAVELHARRPSRRSSTTTGRSRQC